MKGLAGRAAPALALALLIAVLAGLKLKALEAGLPRAGPGGSVLFYSQSAIQYRYAELFARGEPLVDPDRKLQYPEGLSPEGDLTLLSERLIGAAWRLLPEPLRPAFDRFCLEASALSSSLTLAALFWIGAAVFGSPWAGLLAALFHAFSLASFVRAAFGFEHEHFALPLLFLSLAALLASARRGGADLRERALRGAAGGALMAAACFTWHFSRFFWASLTAALLLAYPLMDRKARAELAPGLLGFHGAALALLLLLGRRFACADLAGAAPTLASAFAALLYARSERSVRTGAWGWALFGLGFLLFVRAPEGQGDFNHVWGLMSAHLRWRGEKPESPLDVPLEPRLLWVQETHWTTWRQWLYLFSTLLPVGLFGLGLALRRRREARSDAAQTFLGVAACGWLLGPFLSVRLSGVTAAFLSLYAARAVQLAWPARGRWSERVLLVSLAAGCLYFPVQELLFASTFGVGLQREEVLARAPERNYAPPPRPDETAALLDWIRAETPPDAVLLAHFPIGAQIYAYTGRAINVHPKFERAAVRLKVNSFFQALYGPEDGFLRLCRDFGATYFVYQVNMALDPGVDGILYAAGSRRLWKGSAAYLFHFRPSRLKRFELVKEAGYFRVYRVLADGEKPRRPPRGSELFDERFFPSSAPGDTFLEEKDILKGIDCLSRPQAAESSCPKRSGSSAPASTTSRI